MAWGLRHTIQAGNTNRDVLFSPGTLRSEWPLLGCAVLGRRSITGWEVCSCCRSTQCLPAADLPSSGTLVLTGLVRGEGTSLLTLPRDTFSQSFTLTAVPAWGKFTPIGHCWKMCSASWCKSWECRKRLEMVLCQGLGGCGEECVTLTVSALGIELV